MKTHIIEDNMKIPVSDLTNSAQKRADKMEEGPVFARRGGRGWELTQINVSRHSPQWDKAEQALLDDGWRQIDFGQ